MDGYEKFTKGSFVRPLYARMSLVAGDFLSELVDRLLQGEQTQFAGVRVAGRLFKAFPIVFFQEPQFFAGYFQFPCSG